jgi:hypothetical protein
MRRLRAECHAPAHCGIFSILNAQITQPLWTATVTCRHEEAIRPISVPRARDGGRYAGEYLSRFGCSEKLDMWRRSSGIRSSPWPANDWRSPTSAGTASMVTGAWHSGGLMTGAGCRGSQQPSFPTCSCLLHAAAKTVLEKTFLRMSARRMAKRCLSSGRPWPRRSAVGTERPCR